MGLDRITVTIPRDVLAAADRRARELSRSRSWVVAEALRGYVRAPAVREPVRHPYDAGLGSSRLAQLEADLALTPEDRVHEAERTALEADLVRGKHAGQRLVQFNRYEDYIDWKNREGRFA